MLPLLLVAVATPVLWAYQHPPVPSDQLTYFSWAESWPDLNSDKHLALRIGLLLPVRLAQGLFGYSEAAYFAIPMLAGVGLVLGAYAVGALLHSRLAGGLAAVLFLFSPVFLDEAGELLPDTLAAALFTFAVALVLWFARRYDADHSQWDWLILSVSGLLLGWAYLAREFIILAFFVVPLVFLLRNLPWSRLLWVAVPALVVAAGELVVNAHLYDRPFARIAVAAGHGHTADSKARAAEQGLTRAKVAFRFPAEVLDRFPSMAWILVAFAVGVAIALWRRDRAFAILGSWCGGFWVLLTLFGGGWDPSTPMISTNKPRYWMPILPALYVAGSIVAVLGVRYLVDAVARRGWAPRRVSIEAISTVISVVLAMAVLLVSLGDFRSDRSARVNGGFDEMQTFRSWLSENDASVNTVWSDGETARMLRVYVHTPFGGRLFDGRVRRFEHGARFENLEDVRPGDIVVIGNRRLQQLVAAVDVPDQFFHPSAYGWEKVLATTNNRLKIFTVNEPPVPVMTVAS